MSSSYSNTHQLFRVSPGQMIYSAGGDVDPQRFLSDVNYLGTFVAGFAECLGVKTVNHALIEDATSQTAYCYAVSPDGIGSVINGIFTRHAESPDTLLNHVYQA
jgi:hypothetical protein